MSEFSAYAYNCADVAFLVSHARSTASAIFCGADELSGAEVSNYLALQSAGDWLGGDRRWPPPTSVLRVSSGRYIVSVM